MLGFALSAIALAADSIVPAMIAHFANNACIVALASAGMDADGAPISTKLRLLLIASGSLGLAAGAALLARAHRNAPSQRSR